MTPMRALSFTLAFLLSTAAHAAGSYAQDADTKAILNHRLTMDLVKKTVAMNTAMLDLLEKDPAFEKRAEEAQNTQGLDDSVKAMEAVPQMAVLLKTNGISGRDYLLTQMSIMSTTMTLEFMNKGNMPPLPPDFPTHNIEFWKNNREALQPLEAEWKKTMEALQKRERRR